ncbi:hypothetical protein D3C79_945740 [compost metagenome]
MANGLPAELTRLHQNDDYFIQRVAIMRDARTFLQGSAYDKLLIAHVYRDDRSKALLMVKDCVKIIEHSLKSQPQAKLIRQLERLTGVYDSIEANGNIRLQLLTLVA